MMALNRYRLRHLAKDKNHPGAKRVLSLLARTDRLLTGILIGNTVCNIVASAVATLIGAQLYGDKGIVLATVSLTLIILLFAEIGPKTVTSIYPQRYAFFASIPLKVVLILFYPLVWLGNTITRYILLLFKIRIDRTKNDEFSTDELRSIVKETKQTISYKDQEMLVGVIDLDDMNVEDIMISRTEISAINLNDDWPDILKQLVNSEHTRLPLYDGNLQNIIGVLHMRAVLYHLSENDLNKETLIDIADEPYYIPETISLKTQLIKFQHDNLRMGFLVDEYGEIQGLITLDDILEEVVGNFTTNISEVTEQEIIPQQNGSHIIDASIPVRELNRALNINLPLNKGKTLNGLVCAELQAIPNQSICLKINNYPIEIIRVSDNAVKTVRLFIDD